MPRLLVALLLALAASAPRAQLFDAPSSRGGGGDLPDGFYLEDAVDASFVFPVAVDFAPGGRMFVVEKRGVVRVVENGVLRAEPFIDLSDEVLDHHDRGMLGIAVDPDFATTRRVYLSYTVDHESTLDEERYDAYARVIRVDGSASDPSVADLSTRQILIGETFREGIPSCYFSHTIGTLAVGSDGSLLVSAGDGASYSEMDEGGLYSECFGSGTLDPSEDIGSFRSQRIESLAGKILRIDPETGEGIPSNPFYTGDPEATASKVWALGFRNPYRFSIARDGSTDPAVGRPGTLYVGDVGWTVWEELNVVRGGENYGWPCYEGPDEHPLYQDASPSTNGCDEPPTGILTDPVYYWHQNDPSSSVPPGRRSESFIGGTIYEGDRYPFAYRDRLYYGDYVNGWTASSSIAPGGDPTDDQTFGTTGTIVDYAYDPYSRYLFLVDVWTGRIKRLRHTDEGANAAPVAKAMASPGSGGVGMRVQLSSVGSFDPDGDALSFLWDLGDGRTSTEASPLVRYHQPGDFIATLTLSDGTATSQATVQVRVREGASPTVRISEATRTARPAVGEPIPLTAMLSDPDQGSGSLMVRWNVWQIHEDHAHPDVFTADGPTATFVPPEHGVPGEVVYYRVRVEVRDDSGLEAVDEAALFLTPGAFSSDVTEEATPISLVPVSNLGRLVDGIVPAPGTNDRQYQIKTNGGDPTRETDWIGLEFDVPQRLHALDFVEGRHENRGGWFEAIGVDVRRNGVWVPVTDLRISPAYRAHDDRNYDAYTLSFAPATADAIRLVGPPGGSDGYVTAAELRAYALVDPASSLPEGWASRDIGDVAASGGVAFDEEVFTVAGSGDIWGGSDEFHFVYRPLGTDSEFVARVADLVGENEWSKAGLMVRGSTDDEAAYVGVFVSFRGTHVQVREEASDETDGPVDLWGETAPQWLRLARDGTAWGVSVSEDGTSWTEIAREQAEVGAAPLVGLAVSAADYGDGRIAQATFDHVSGTSSSPPPPQEWISRDVGAPLGAGALVIDGDALVITGGGDVWGDQDRFHLVSRTMEGDGSFVARVASLVGESDWSKAGLMLRLSDSPGSPYIGVFQSKIGAHLQLRSEEDGPSAGPRDRWAPFTPAWFRLDRTGTTVAAFASLDGANWVPVGTADVAALTGPLVAGLSVSAGDVSGADVATARFEGAEVYPVSSAALPPNNAVADDPVGFGIDGAYPNPTRGAFTVRVTTEREGMLTVELFDTLGRRIEHRDVMAADGVAEVSFGERALPPGTYLIRLRDEVTGGSAVQRVTVVK